MRILHLDIDSLRPDHLSCYGYRRRTSPAIDAIAARGVRFENCFASDVPCLPSRTSLFFGRHGFRHGAVNHSGTRAQPFEEIRLRPDRSLVSPLAEGGLVYLLRRAGLRTATISSFAERHSAWHVLSGFGEVIDTGHAGHEIADDVTPAALDWLDRNGRGESWYLHVQYWDVHIPYRTPPEFRPSALDTPVRRWLDQATIDEHRSRPGIRSARGMLSVANYAGGDYPRQPFEIATTGDFDRMIDGYDAAVCYVDLHVGRLVQKLRQLGIADDTAIIVSADHGECLGELNTYCGHNLADAATCRVPLVLSWPGAARPGSVVDAPIYQMDLAPTLLELLGIAPPADFDAVSLKPLLEGRGGARPFLVLSQLAQSAQRSVVMRQGDELLLLIETYDPVFQDLPRHLLFDLARDPHERDDLAARRPEMVDALLGLLESWKAEMLARSPSGRDPLATVLVEGPQTRIGRDGSGISRLPLVE